MLNSIVRLYIALQILTVMFATGCSSLQSDTKPLAVIPPSPLLRSPEDLRWTKSQRGKLLEAYTLIRTNIVAGCLKLVEVRNSRYEPLTETHIKYLNTNIILIKGEAMEIIAKDFSIAEQAPNARDAYISSRAAFFILGTNNTIIKPRWGAFFVRIREHAYYGSIWKCENIHLIERGNTFKRKSDGVSWSAKPGFTFKEVECDITCISNDNDLPYIKQVQASLDDTITSNKPYTKCNGRYICSPNVLLLDDNGKLYYHTVAIAADNNVFDDTHVFQHTVTTFSSSNNTLFVDPAMNPFGAWNGSSVGGNTHRVDYYLGEVSVGKRLHGDKKRLRMLFHVPEGIYNLRLVVL